MDIFHLIFQFLGAKATLLVIAGALIGWHLPEPAWAKVLWTALHDLWVKVVGMIPEKVLNVLVMLKDFVVSGAMSVKNFVLPSKKVSSSSLKKKKK